jgi:hypothetical protein
MGNSGSSTTKDENTNYGLFSSISGEQIGKTFSKKKRIEDICEVVENLNEENIKLIFKYYDKNKNNYLEVEE